MYTAWYQVLERKLHEENMKSEKLNFRKRVDEQKVLQ